MHPLFVQLWIKLGNTLIPQIELTEEPSKKTKLTSYLSTCYFVIKEINKHGHAHRSELVVKQKLLQKKWVNYLKRNSNYRWVCFLF